MTSGSAEGLSFGSRRLLTRRPSRYDEDRDEASCGLERVVRHGNRVTGNGLGIVGGMMDVLDYVALRRPSCKEADSWVDLVCRTVRST